jgi:hypothetical protein
MRKLIGLTALLLAMTGCGDGGAAEESSVTADTVVTTVSATTTLPESGVVPIGAAPCDLLTAQEVEAATGLSVLEVLDDPPITCLFDLGAEAGVDIAVIVEDGAGRLGGAANLFREYLLLVDEGEAEVITGVGEQAVCCPFRTIAVDAGGGRFVAVSVWGGYNELAEPLEVLVSLAGSVLGRL